MQICQQIKPNDRKEFVVDIPDRIRNYDKFLQKILFRDEVIFHVSGEVNRNNCSISESENPHCVREIERGSHKP